MLVSYSWLQTYFKTPLPEPRELGLLLNTRAFEVEGITAVAHDFAIDIDVQPNRAHDCLCHEGIAREIGVLTRMPVQHTEAPVLPQMQPARHAVQCTDTRVTRYVSAEIDAVRITATPSVLAERLAVLGQRSINVAVDIANYIMFEVGQPLHIFDADKVSGDLVLRVATAGEQLTTLDGVEVTLQGGELVVADSAGVLAIAGIKGGNRAAVTETTTRVLLEVAHFDASTIRQTSTALGISTDASKRFERAITPILAERAMHRFIALVSQYMSTPETVYYAPVDVYPRPVGTYKTGVALREVNNYLGTTYDDATITATLAQLGFAYEVVQPHERVVAQAQELVSAASYKLGASVLYDAPAQFDCSSLIAYLYKEAGVSVPRVSVDQYMWGTPITAEELLPGDIIFCNLGASSVGEDKQYYHETTVAFMKGTPIPEKVDHNGIYIGNGEVIHASSKAGNTVVRERLSESKIFEHIVGYRRMVPAGESRYVITVPDERLDLRIPQDIIEEIARVHGYEHIVPQPIATPQRYEVNAEYAYLNHIRTLLVAAGFTEVMTSTFTAAGVIAAQKPLASDKAFLRTNLTDGMQKTLAHNDKLLDVLGIDRVRVFEIGRVFTEAGEELRIALGISGKKADALVAEMLTALSLTATPAGGIAECVLNVPSVHEDVSLQTCGQVVYQPFSVYPFIVRDIALWVPQTVTGESVEMLIREHAGPLLARLWLFDVYQKEDRTSYAFRLVFQSHERTLTDAEVATSMDAVTHRCIEAGFEVR
ncbi:MAG: hypothetical protein RL150_421 [Candidatus Parcubacteria bacterium]|jgi:phenylalanyl-tRNA synthetase beta subunit